MNKRTSRCISLLLLMMTFISIFSSTTVFASTTVKSKYVQSNTYLDGEFRWFYEFKILGSSYFKLSELAESFSGTSSQFAVVWNNSKKSIHITTGKKYTPLKDQDSTYYSIDKYYDAKPLTKKIYIDGKLSNIKGYSIGGNDYFKIRDLSTVLSFDMEWNSSNKEILLYSQTPKQAYRVKTAYESNSNSVSSYFSRWSSALDSYIIDNNNKTISVIEANENINIETYDDKYKLISKKSIRYELPIFGTFYSGEKYNYIAFGQNNSEENDNKEVIRIVRYDKNFKRIDSVSIKGGNCYTTIPFDAACGRMSENGDRLVFHTSRQRYRTSDGLNHQSQLTIIVDTSTMKVVNDLGRFQSNHVSHSFDQYVQFDGNAHILVDHGDAYPRAIVLSKEYIDINDKEDIFEYPENIFENSDGDVEYAEDYYVEYPESQDFNFPEDNGFNYKVIDLFEIPGSTGANCTGVSIGGFEISSENYIVAFNSIKHSLVKQYTSYVMTGLGVDQRDIIICALPKDDTRGLKLKQITLAKYVGTSKIASIPQLVKISEDKLMVLWQEYNIKTRVQGDLKYVFLDKNGNATTKIKSMKNFTLSECKPIVIGKKVVWYTNEKGCRVFYTIPIN